MMNHPLTFGVFAHVDAGKTTLCEQILAEAGTIRTAGRVDHGNTFLDTENVERERGITVFSAQASFSYHGRVLTLIDTPGHADFSAEMERALDALDAAVVVISAPEGVQAHTRTVWWLLKERKLPVFFFVNKIDRSWPGEERLCAQLQETLETQAWPLGSLESLSEPMIEALAQEEESLLEAFLEGKREKDFWLKALKAHLNGGRIAPVLFGSALKGEGVEALLRALAELVITRYDAQAPFAARVLRIRHDAQGQRLALVKVTAGTLRPRDPIAIGEDIWKANELRKINGNRYERMEEARAGEHVVLTALPGAQMGMGLGKEPTAESSASLTPLLRAAVEAGEGVQARVLLDRLRVLEEEDPLLDVAWLEERQSVQISYMGPVQLEVLSAVCQERFGMAVRFGPPEILYRETIASPVIGSGHYEPLRHYAEVHLGIRPLKRGSGLQFEDAASLDDLPLPYHSLVKTHLFERAFPGALTGSGLTDVCFTLLAGRAHLKHTEGGDFREAVCRAVRQALFKAENILLEPYYRYTAQLEAGLAGKASAELHRLNAPVERQEIRGETAVLIGRGPVATLMDYAQAFTVLTRGRGNLNFAFDGYDVCHNAQEVTESRAYDREADRRFPADSVFCQKGAGVWVSWKEADSWMHIDRKELLEGKIPREYL